MIQLYEFTVLRFYHLFLLTLQYIDTLRLYAFTILRLYRLPPVHAFHEKA